MDGSNEKGDIAEAEITAAAIRAGCTVSRPATDHAPYDLVIEAGGRLVRGQCKWAPLKSGVVHIRLRRCSHSPTRGYVRTGYHATEVDAIAAYCDELKECFLVPIEEAVDRGCLSLRVDAARNGQRAGVHFAAQYRLSGAVAQLEERRHGMPEVRGSSPLSSTPSSPAVGRTRIGANTMREQFSYWMERASAGERILITRRGRPLAQLGPPDEEAGGERP